MRFYANFTITAMITRATRVPTGMPVALLVPCKAPGTDIHVTIDPTALTIALLVFANASAVKLL